MITVASYFFSLMERRRSFMSSTYRLHKKITSILWYDLGSISHLVSRTALSSPINFPSSSSFTFWIASLCIRKHQITKESEDMLFMYGSREGSTTFILTQFAMKVQNRSLQWKSAKFEMEAWISIVLSLASGYYFFLAYTEKTAVIRFPRAICFVATQKSSCGRDTGTEI